MIEKQPKVSVIMPIYNTKPEYLREAIDSVLAQTFGDFELLLCDDCSDAYIREIVDTYDDSRIVYVRNPKNLGTAGARNRLIDIARGKYLALLDSDDTMHPTRLAKQVEFLDDNSDTGVLGTLATINGAGLYNGTRFDPRELEEHLIFSGCALCNSSVMLRKSIIDKHHIRYRAEFIPAEDYALYCDLIGLTKFAVLPEVLCDHRSYDGNISNRLVQKQRYNAALAQYGLVERYLNISLVGKLEMAAFASFKIPKNAAGLIAIYEANLSVLKNFPQQAERFFVTHQNCYRLMCYKIHSFGKQLQLLRSPLRKFFKQSFGWQLFCFITRGLLSFKK